MYRFELKTPKQKRKLRVGSKVFGTSDRPRVSVFRSNRFISAQIIDDERKVTLVSCQQKPSKGKTKTEVSLEMGKELAKKALDKKITRVVFDRGSYRYHGRVKALADGLREGGLEL